MKVLHEGDNIKAIFYIEENGERIALMEYVYAGSDKFIIEHTEVNEHHEGKGLGKLLVKAAVEYGRKRAMKIIPLCPYANAVFNKTPDYVDVWFGK